jgi:hypothetical protein
MNSVYGAQFNKWFDTETIFAYISLKQCCVLLTKVMA